MSLQTAPAREGDRAPAARSTASAPPEGTVVQTSLSAERSLARLADNPHLLPSPPGVVMQVLEKASQPGCKPAELAALIYRDAALYGKIIKTVNSALYGLPRSVTSIEQAVALLGLNPVRSLVLGLSLPAMQQQAGNKRPIKAFWKESIAGAIVAHELAIRLRRLSAGDDLVAGLLRDIGVLALQQVFPTEYTRLLTQPAQELARNRCQLERQMVGVDHAEVSAFLLRRWWLPEDITEAVRYHHAPEQAGALPHPVAERVRLLSFASSLAQLQLDAEQPELLRDILAFGRQHYGLDEAALTVFLEPVAKKIEDFAALVDLDIGSCDHYPRILAHAADTLVQLTLENRVDQMRALEQKRQAEQETHRLRGELQRDALTGAFNRGGLEEQLRLQFRRARRRGTLLGAIFIDLDNFKGINDRFGHLIGDYVLKEISRSLLAAVRHSDLVARYGGDEFCILVENTSQEELKATADRLWQTLRNRVLDADGRRVVISASIGAVLCLPRSYSQSATDLIGVADRAMYTAKSSGKNQVTFISLLSEADRRFLAAVERLRFGTRLRGLGIKAPSCEQGARFESPGRLARRLGWVTTEQLRLILREQRATGRRFDEIASERTLLTPNQLSALIALQLEPPQALAAQLANQGILSESAMREKLRSYYQWLAR